MALFRDGNPLLVKAGKASAVGIWEGKTNGENSRKVKCINLGGKVKAEGTSI